MKKFLTLASAVVLLTAGAASAQTASSGGWGAKTPLLDSVAGKFNLNANVGAVYNFGTNWSGGSGSSFIGQGTSNVAPAYGASPGSTSKTGFGVSADYLGFHSAWENMSSNMQYDAVYNAVTFTPSYRFSFGQNREWGLRLGLGLGFSIADVKWAGMAGSARGLAGGVSASAGGATTSGGINWGNPAAKRAAGGAYYGGGGRVDGDASGNTVAKDAFANTENSIDNTVAASNAMQCYRNVVGDSKNGASDTIGGRDACSGSQANSNTTVSFANKTFTPSVDGHPVFSPSTVGEQCNGNVSSCLLYVEDSSKASTDSDIATKLLSGDLSYIKGTMGKDVWKAVVNGVTSTNAGNVVALLKGVTGSNLEAQTTSLTVNSTIWAALLNASGKTGADRATALQALLDKSVILGTSANAVNITDIWSSITNTTTQATLIKAGAITASAVSTAAWNDANITDAQRLNILSVGGSAASGTQYSSGVWSRALGLTGASLTNAITALSATNSFQTSASAVTVSATVWNQITNATTQLNLLKANAVAGGKVEASAWNDSGVTADKKKAILANGGYGKASVSDGAVGTPYVYDVWSSALNGASGATAASALNAYVADAKAANNGTLPTNLFAAGSSVATIDPNVWNQLSTDVKTALAGKAVAGAAATTGSTSPGAAKDDAGLILAPQIAVEYDNGLFHGDISLRYIHELVDVKFNGQNNGPDQKQKSGPLAVFFGAGFGVNF